MVASSSERTRPSRSPNKSNFTKKTPPKALVVQEEYNEDDDDDEDGESVAMASVAIATTPRVSLFDSPNESITAKCLMAKATNKVTPNIKTTIITNPSLIALMKMRGLMRRKMNLSLL